MEPIFRNLPLVLSEAEVEKVIREHNLFDALYNAAGQIFPNQFELMLQDRVVFDHATGLMWQRSGSDKIDYRVIRKWLQTLNAQAFAGYHDWRLPTIEEALTLLEAKKDANFLYVNPIFDPLQKQIWTADIKNQTSAWAIFFSNGHCYYSDTHQKFNTNYYVRAVR